MSKMKGSVEELPSGKWRLRITIGRNENGNPKNYRGSKH